VILFPRGGVDDQDDRLEVPACGGLLMVVDDDYGDGWELNCSAAKIYPTGPYPFGG
jgi:hypothetical protein